MGSFDSIKRALIQAIAYKEKKMLRVKFNYREGLKEVLDVLIEDNVQFEYKGFDYTDLVEVIETDLDEEDIDDLCEELGISCKVEVIKGK